MKNFFISYNRADKGWAEWIAWQLEEADYSTVLQAWDFTPGTNFVLQMHEAAKDAERTIAVLSPDYLASSFTKPEWAAAFAQDPTGEKGLLVPIRVGRCDPAGLLGQIVYADVVGSDEVAAKVALLAAVKRGRAKPDAQPAFPPTVGRSVTARPRFPGALPPIWNVPHRRNPNFTGREELLRSLHASLASGDYAALTQAMHGLGGVGKTQTAIEYAYRYASEYDAVLWVPAEDPAALAGHFAALVGVIGLNVDPADQSSLVTAVHQWLRGNTRWLLIFDNAEAAADIQGYLPQAGSGQAIITSRNPEWRKIAKSLQVPSLSRGEAVAFLMTRVCDRAEDESEQAAAAILASELGGLALALEQAAAYADTNGLSLSGYLGVFERHRERALSSEACPDYPWTLESVWAISIDKVKFQCPAAVELLILLAFFGPDDIPINLLRSSAALLPAALEHVAANELELRKAVRILRQHSLVEATDEFISIHRVVQAVTRYSLKQPERRFWAEVAARIVREGMSADPVSMTAWKSATRLIPHANMIAQHTEREGASLKDAAECLNLTGMHLYSRADYKSAKYFLEYAARLAEAVYGFEHPQVASVLNNLGATQRALGDAAGAQESLAHAIQIDEKVFGPDHPEVAIELNTLAGVQIYLGDFASACTSLERALGVFETTLGPDDLQVAMCLSNLAAVQINLGDYNRARGSIERALQIGELKLGSGHPKTAEMLNNLAIVQREQGDLVSAQASFVRTLEILEPELGTDHPRIATLINNLATVQRDLGDLTNSRLNFERALRMFQEALGPHHPDVGLLLSNLGDIHAKLGDTRSAQASFEHALQIFEVAFGLEHPNCANTLNNLGSLQHQLGEFAKAQASLERALHLFGVAFGQEHPLVARCLVNLGALDEERVDLWAARRKYERALTILRKLRGKSHSETLAVESSLTRLIRKMYTSRFCI